MRTETRRNQKYSWVKTVAEIRKWPDIKTSGDDFHSDYNSSCFPVGPDPPALASDSIKMFVGTWNVGGRSPCDGELNLKDWLMNTSSPADVYVLGFQEIVQLNACNVLGAKDRGPAHQWLSLIDQTLNNDKNRPFKPRLGFSGLLSMGDGEVDRYCLAASKQMVGIFLCVWVRADLMQQVTGLEDCCVPTGFLGCMGNKGSISISMTLCHTTFCFVCTHLTCGEKYGDEEKRNSDVMEILRKTSFLPSDRSSESAAVSPATILEHDKILWLGDLNYRLAAGRGDVVELLGKNDLQALLAKDQLRIEQSAGKVFTEWQEGRICFPPTYKYVKDSDRYAVDGDKGRTPAWCDRILWRGKGMKQMWYKRGELRFSDHKPVHSLFSVQLDNCDNKRAAAVKGKAPRQSLSSRSRRAGPTNTTTMADGGSSNSSASSCGRVQAEELLETRMKSRSGTSRFRTIHPSPT